MTSTRASARAAKRRKTFRRTTKPSDPRNRLIALLVVFVIIGAGFVAVLVDLQTVRPDRYRSLGEDQRTRTRQIAGYRGAIVDRNGFVLAASTPSHQIVADPTLVEDADETASLLAPILDLDVDELAAMLVPTSETDRFSLLARNVDDEAVGLIQQLAADDDSDSDPQIGIFILPEEDRVYPAGELASAVVGRVDPDEQGIHGVESQYNEAMTGIPGTEQYERGRFGSISVGDWKVDPATAGDNVVLTIDNRIQYVTEQALLEHCESARANGASAIMSQPDSGEILAMAAVIRNDDGDCEVAGYNATLIDSYELGSVVKPLVVAAATEELGYTADTTIEVPARVSVGGKSFADHPVHASAPYPISQILGNSMNVGTILISQQIPVETLYNYLVAFGLGEPTGLEVDGEVDGVLRHPDDWWGADYGSIPIGQGITMNAAQLLSAYNVLANGGTYVPPVLVKSLEAADGSVLDNSDVAGHQVLTERTTDELTRSLRTVVETGTGERAAVPGYSVAGKTGTAWKVFDDGSGKLGYGSTGNRRYVVTFVGYLPAEDPQLSLAVIVDEPYGDATASAYAAPIFAEIADYAVRILAIPPAGGGVDGDERVRGTPARAATGEVAGPGSAPRTGPVEETNR